MKYTNNTIRINFFFIICIVLLFVLFFAKLGYIALAKVVEGTNLKELADSRTIVTKTLKAERGSIYDINGTTLAQNVNSYTVIAYLSKSRTTDERYPKHVIEKEKTAEKLSEVLITYNKTMTKEYILKLLNLDRYQVELGPGGKDVSELVKKQIEALALPGIDFIKTKKRYYPNGDFASYIVGYAKKDEEKDEIVGELGIEAFANRYLKGTDGSITYQKDAYGYQIQLSDEYSYVTPAQDGYDIYLTLDEQIQLALEDAVNKFEENYVNAEEGWAIFAVADAKTGAIVGSATSPGYNPNTLADIKNYNNPLVSYTYEPGSTMKIFSFMSAMEENLYDGEELYKSGKIPVGDYVINDWYKAGWGKISFDVGFTYSSNVAAVLLAERLKINRLTNYYNNLGFGSKTGIELANELAGKVDLAYESELATASYGQGVVVTPIQMLQALTVLSNDGMLLKPYIIDHIVDKNTGEIVYQGKRNEIKKIYSSATVNKMLELLDRTVNNEDRTATGVAYHTDTVQVIGKTGTANYTDKNGKYVEGTYNVIRSFAGLFPKDDPEYIVYVAVKDFKGATSKLAKIVTDVIESIAKYRQFDDAPVEKDLSKVITVGNYLSTKTSLATSNITKIGGNAVTIGDGDMVINQYPKANTRITQDGKIYLITNSDKIKMPDMTNWSSSEVLNYCNIVGLKCELSGYGYVQSTNIKKDDIITKESQLKVTLKSKKIDSLSTEEGTTNAKTTKKTTTKTTTKRG